jgi:hypothetical protein
VFENARRYLDAEGCHLIWTERGITHRFWLDETPIVGRHYSAALVPDDMGSVRAWAFLRFCHALSGRADPGPYRAMTARTALLYRQSLAAMDARAAGASEWEIGQSLFGYQRSRDEWSDNAARGQVRRTLAGGYRQFLTWQAGGSNRRPRI